VQIERDRPDDRVIDGLPRQRRQRLQEFSKSTARA
jgi:hypothetical protein